MSIKRSAIKKVMILLILGFPNLVYSQEDLLNILENEQSEDAISITNNTFKGTRLINGHTVEVRDQQVLVFLITHRFGRLNTGTYEFFGLDNANIRLGFDYGITDRLTVGIGRSSFEKVYDGFVKYQLLRQSRGSRTMPFTVSLLGSISVKTLRSGEPDVSIPFEHKLAYTTQLLIARKFSDRLSFQIMPSLVHRNFVEDVNDENTIFVLGVGGRIKLSQRLALTGEYYYRMMGQEAENISNSLSVGLDIETGGHVFQLMLTNSRQMVNKGFLTETDGQWGEGDIHFGFNISRIFYLNNNRDRKKDSW